MGFVPARARRIAGIIDEAKRARLGKIDQWYVPANFGTRAFANTRVEFVQCRARSGQNRGDTFGGWPTALTFTRNTLALIKCGRIEASTPRHCSRR